MNSITIGRNPQNTIVVGAEYTTVSGNHATIEQVGNQLYLTDHSTNGTYINGSLVHNRRVAISPSDRITLSTHYPLNMQQVMQHLAPAASPSRATARYVPTPETPANRAISTPSTGEHSCSVGYGVAAMASIGRLSSLSPMWGGWQE